MSKKPCKPNCRRCEEATFIDTNPRTGRAVAACCWFGEIECDDVDRNGCDRFSEEQDD